MTFMDGACEVCGYESLDGKLRVCALPSFPVSIAHCVTCLQMGIFPYWVVDATLCDEPLNLDLTLVKHGLHATMAEAADWFLDSLIWEPVEPGEPELIGCGRPLSVREYLARRLRSGLFVALAELEDVRSGNNVRLPFPCSGCGIAQKQRRTYWSRPDWFACDCGTTIPRSNVIRKIWMLIGETMMDEIEFRKMRETGS